MERPVTTIFYPAPLLLLPQNELIKANRGKEGGEEGERRERKCIYLSLMLSTMPGTEGDPQ